MLRTISFRIKKFDKEFLQNFSNALTEKGLSHEVKWQKVQGIKAVPCSKEEGSSLILSEKGFPFLKASYGSVELVLEKLPPLENSILMDTLKQSGYIKQPGFLWPIVLSVLHFLILMFIILATSQELRRVENILIMVNCSISLFLIYSGIFLWTMSFTRRRPFRIFMGIVLVTGILLTFPSSALQISLIQSLAERQLCSYLKNNGL